MAALERLVTQLVADTRDWSRGLQVAQGQLATFERRTTSQLSGISVAFARAGSALAAAFTVDRIVSFARETLEALDAIADLSAAAGISAETFQRLRSAFGFANVGADEFAASMVTLNRVTGLAVAGEERAIKAFARLGIDAESAAFKVKTQDQILRDVIVQLGSYGSAQERAGAASRLLGESAGPKMAAALREGVDAFDEIARKATVFTDEQVARTEQLNDRLEVLKTTVGTKLRQAWIDAQAGFYEMATGADLSPIEQQIGDLIVRIGDLRAEAQSNPLLGMIRGTEREIARLEEKLAGLRKQVDDKKADADSRKQAEIDAREEAERERKRTRDAEQSARDQKQRDAEIARGRKQAKDDSYRAEEKELLKRYELEEKMREKGLEEERAAKDAEIEMILERDRAWKKTLEGLQQDAAKTLADVAVNGEAAWDRLKQRAIAAITEIAIRWAAAQIFGAPGGDAAAGSLGGIFGQVVLGTPSTPTHARGGMPMTGVPALVGERGPELFVPQQAGTIVPSGRFSLGGAAPQTTVQLGVEVSIEQGMTATQERRRGIDGRERVLVAVRSANADDVSRRGPLSRLIASETGQRQAPRKGIS